MKKHLLILTLIMGMLFVLTACGGTGDTANDNGSNLSLSGQTQTADVDSIFHQFDTLGFSIEFPGFWAGKYGTIEIEQNGNQFVEVYHIATRDEFYILFDHEFGGRLFTLGRVVGEHYTYYDAPIMAGGSIFFAQTGGYTYFVNFPSGVEYNYDDPDSEAAAEYEEMIGHWDPSHWDFLINSFRLTE